MRNRQTLKVKELQPLLLAYLKADQMTQARMQDLVDKLPDFEPPPKDPSFAMAADIILEKTAELAAFRLRKALQSDLVDAPI